MYVNEHFNKLISLLHKIETLNNKEVHELVNLQEKEQEFEKSLDSDKKKRNAIKEQKKNIKNDTSLFKVEKKRKLSKQDENIKYFDNRIQSVEKNLNVISNTC